jgi:serine/threonine-protein kinase
VVKGKYRIKARLGEGGMAVVYKAHHELLDELRALKVIRPDLARDTEFMGRFKNEAIMARKLNHPNAVRVDDLDIAEDGLPFIAMELVVGDTLKTLVSRVGALPVSLVLDVSLHVCEALDAAHKLGLIHRDIKPDNIVLIAQRQGPPQAKILDFGISRLRQETAGAKGLTQTGMVIGTPEYMSPEQVMGKKGDEIDGRSDLYSLGIVMYRMLTGELPFQGETTTEMFLQHLNTPPKAPHQLKPDLKIPEEVSAIVMKALEKDREKRYATGADMVAALRKARGSPTLSTRKIDWSSLSTAAGSFGAETDAPSRPAAASPAAVPSAPSVPPPPRPTPPAGVAPSPPPSERSIYTTAYTRSARIAPPKESSLRMILMIVLGIILLVGAFVVGKYFGSGHTGKGTTSEPGVATPSGGEKAQPRGGTTSAIHAGQRPMPRTDLSDAEKARIKELNSTAAIFLQQGGCEKALPSYQKVLDIDPGNPTAYDAVRKCYAQARSGGSTSPAPSPPADSPNPNF